MTPEILVRDVNGNTLFRAEMPDVPGYGSLAVDEAHISDSGTVIVTLYVEEGENR